MSTLGEPGGRLEREKEIERESMEGVTLVEGVAHYKYLGRPLYKIDDKCL